jgi:hypothetical protein
MIYDVGPLIFLIGWVFLLLPAVFLGLAWRSLSKHPELPTGRRRQNFLIVLGEPLLTTGCYGRMLCASQG